MHHVHMVAPQGASIWTRRTVQQRISTLGLLKSQTFMCRTAPQGDENKGWTCFTSCPEIARALNVQQDYGCRDARAQAGLPSGIVSLVSVSWLRTDDSGFICWTVRSIVSPDEEEDLLIQCGSAKEGLQECCYTSTEVEEEVKIKQYITTLHHNTCHPSNTSLASSLRRKGAGQRVTQLALAHRCDACAEGRRISFPDSQHSWCTIRLAGNAWAAIWRNGQSQDKKGDLQNDIVAR